MTIAKPNHNHDRRRSIFGDDKEMRGSAVVFLESNGDPEQFKNQQSTAQVRRRFVLNDYSEGVGW